MPGRERFSHVVSRAIRESAGTEEFSPLTRGYGFGRVQKKAKKASRLMRVNMDSSIVSDPRFKLIAKELCVNWKQVIGSCFLLWLACYERRTICMSIREADISAEQDGFSVALIRAGLADRLGDDTIRIHGMEVRIQFLLDQSSKGRKGGKARGKRQLPSICLAGAKADASGAAQAYPPSPTPALIPPTPQRGADEDCLIGQEEFSEWLAMFLEEYPRHRMDRANHRQAIRAWHELKPDEVTSEKIIISLRAWKESDKWREKQGQYVNKPQKFLRDRLWEFLPVKPHSDLDLAKAEMMARRKEQRA